MRSIVSLLSPDSLLLYLAPDKVQAVHLRGWRQRIVGLHQMPIKGLSGDDFQSVLDAALSMVKTLRPQSVRVLLADQWVRYFCFPWRPELRNAGEELAFARLSFDDIYGANSSEGWRMTFSTEAPGQARLTAAVPEALLGGLKTKLADAKVKLVSVRTQLVAAIQAFPKSLPQAGWIMSHEPGRLSIAAWDVGGWQWVSSSRIASDVSSRLVSRFQQELILSGVRFDDHDTSIMVNVFAPTLAAHDWGSFENLKINLWKMPPAMLGRFQRNTSPLVGKETAMNEFSQVLAGFHL